MKIKGFYAFLCGESNETSINCICIEVKVTIFNLYYTKNI